MKKLYLIFPEKLGTIAPEIYGHFTEHIGGVIYDGIWVGRDSAVPNVNGLRKFLMDKLKAINPPVIRWPGGCFAETYNWRDGIGPDRPVRINWWYNCDKRLEPNEVGTHEFMDFCDKVGAEPYVAANITSVTPLEVRDWIDYCNSPKGSTSLSKERETNGHSEPFHIKYWGIGNENWGGGGNMTPEVYAHEYRKYSTVANNSAAGLKLIACGPNGADYHWTQECMKVLSNSEKNISGYSLHYYCGSAGDPVAFTENEYYQQLKQALAMEEILVRHFDIIKGYAMDKQVKLVIDEWGCWHKDGSGPSKGYNLFEQQSSLRDGLVAALTLNIFNNHCDKIMMANIAQLVNNLHSLFLASGEHCIVTPTYYVFDMYKEHQGATAIKTIVDQDSTIFTGKEGREEVLNNISVSASYKEEFVTITIANLSAKDSATFDLETVGAQLLEDATITVLNHEDYHAHNTFESPDNVKTCTLDMKLKSGITIPAAGVVSIRAGIKNMDN